MSDVLFTFSVQAWTETANSLSGGEVTGFTNTPPPAVEAPAAHRGTHPRGPKNQALPGKGLFFLPIPENCDLSFRQFLSGFP